VTVGALREGARGVAGEAARVTWPVKPPSAVTVIVELFEAPPAIRVRKCRLASRAMLGPVTVTRISAEWNSEPLDPSTPTV